MLTQVQKIQLKNAVLQVLHVQGNYRGGILEMAIVTDHALSREYVESTTKDMVTALKQTDSIFRNVRLNTIEWYGDEKIEKNVTAIPFLQMSSHYETYTQEEDSEKKLEILAEHLKKFYARSKLIIVLTNGAFQVQSQSKLEEMMKPFLHRKMVMVSENKINRY